MHRTPLLPGTAVSAGGEKNLGGHENVVASSTAGKQRGRKAVSKNLVPKKQPQRGMGVAQLEQLRQREQWKKRAADGASAAAVNLGFLHSPLPDHRFQMLPPSFHDPLAGAPIHFTTAPPQPQGGAYGPAIGDMNQWTHHQQAYLQPGCVASSAAHGGGGPLEVPYNPSSQYTFKKKRTEHYGLPEKAPVTGYCQYSTGPTYVLNEFGAASDHQVLAVRRKILENSIMLGRKICHEHQFFPQKINGYNINNHESSDDHTNVDGTEPIDLSLRL